MAGKRTRCPTCNKFGNSALGGYCKNHAKKSGDEHISESYLDKGYGFTEKEFIPKSFSIIKDKCNIMR